MKKDKLPSLVTIMIITLITCVLWVSLSTYRAFTAKAPEIVPKEISDPITPTLDQDTIKKVESGIFFTSSQVPDGFTLTSPLPIPTRPPEILQTATPEATLILSPSPIP